MLVSWTGTTAGALAAVASFVVGVTPGQSAALLVGIDQYQDPVIADLPAAAVDVEDLAGALRTAVGMIPTVLTGSAASKSAIFAAFQDLVSQASVDEPIIFAFAGHGTQVPDTNGDEEDGLDEAFLLSGLYIRDPSVDQMIVDDEIDALIGSAAPRPVIVIADSCHSGTVVRSIDPRISPPPSRFQPVDSTVRGLGRIELPEASKAHAKSALFAAVQEAYRAEGVLIDGELRGALSWAAARGLEGAADDGDGSLTLNELADYVAQTVAAISDGRQTPVLEIASEVRDLVIARYSSTQGKPDTDSNLAHAPLPIALRGGESTPFRFDQVNAVLVSPYEAELTLDVGTGEVVTSSGDIAVDLTPAWTVTEFGAVVEKYRFLRLLRHNTDGRIIGSLSDGPREYHDGEKLRVMIESDVAGYLLLFALSADGAAVRIGSGPEPISDDESLSFPLRVGPPFGGDHIVAVISSDARPVENWIQSVEGGPLDAKEVDRFELLLSTASAFPVSIYTVRR